MGRMRGMGQRGFSLIELLLAAALLATVVVVGLDAMVDVMHNRNRENLSYRLNQEAQMVLDRMTRDIENAGFRFASSDDILASFGIQAMDTPVVNHLRMSCVVGVAQLANDAVQGATTLDLQGTPPSPGGAVLLTFAGDIEYTVVSSVNTATNRVTLSGTGLARAYPAGTLVASIARIEYEINGSQLIRRENGQVTSQVAVDPEGTSISFTWGEDLDNNGEMENQFSGNLLTQQRLANLLTVNVALQLTRTAGTTRGDNLSMTQTASQRIQPLNLIEYNSQ